MPYPEAMVQPMREELTRLGVDELTTAADVNAAFDEAGEDTMLLVINSVCGCAAANARPAVAMARQSGGPQPESVGVNATVQSVATSPSVVTRRSSRQKGAERRMGRSR